MLANENCNSLVLRPVVPASYLGIQPQLVHSGDGISRMLSLNLRLGGSTTFIKPFEGRRALLLEGFEPKSIVHGYSSAQGGTLHNSSAAEATLSWGNACHQCDHP